ncbi:leucine-rich repeat extensin-like protein 1 isoform X2 [Daphnia magna]|uniref:leucine-rich repeat extensin-like protein 1 isoform X2 n=1 Tax=Daphnia magna TaxID=35525 RepID=UPI001E1BAB09|nr:leucine-rich repeat extensin-like protein 1 isoform X2 [Daphnia magna]
MAPTASLPFNSLTSGILFVLILVLVVDDIVSFKIYNKAKGEAAKPLYGIILNAPYPKQNYIKPPPYQQPYKQFRPVYRPPPPVSYVKPQPTYYPPPPPYYPVPPPSVVHVPYRPPAPYTPPVTQTYPQPEPYYPPVTQTYPQPEPYHPPVTQTYPQPEPYHPPVTQTYPQPEPYRPPVTPAYQSTTSAPYRPPVRPSGSRPMTFPVPTTFDNKPWEAFIPTSASYVLDPAFQLNEVDGYPWTQQLREVEDHEEKLEDKLPELLFRDKLPSKSLAQQHASENDINFIPNPELRN